MSNKTALQKRFDEVEVALEVILSEQKECSLNDVISLLGWHDNGHCREMIVHVAVNFGYRVEKMLDLPGQPYRIFDW